ncbi:hypothetical protein D9758_002401 [Tetrapyrgos nigripes]|uniref:Golgi apparatus membrane protein TVP23 n=1 Tax=Tetrapyrgos nigripes TaxID=182062 RepID=A0A8H5LT16_9AGAR|nr:hypothetical protein D9758_002401 [Tetrapyrgos nigripes]
MSVSTPLLDNTIEPDDPSIELSGNIRSANPNSASTRQPVVLTPTNRATQSSNTGLASTQSDAESGIAGIFRQSAHPVALFFLYLFKIAAIGVYVVSGFFTDSYVLFSVIVVVLLAADFWNCRVIHQYISAPVDSFAEIFAECFRKNLGRIEVLESSALTMTERATGYLKVETLQDLQIQSTPDRPLRVPSPLGNPTDRVATATWPCVRVTLPPSAPHRLSLPPLPLSSSQGLLTRNRTTFRPTLISHIETDLSRSYS